MIFVFYRLGQVLGFLHQFLIIACFLNFVEHYNDQNYLHLNPRAEVKHYHLSFCYRKIKMCNTLTYNCFISLSYIRQYKRV